MAVKRMQCWERKSCGRGPDGEKACELGVCPAVTDENLDGVNGGKGGGRCCWRAALTECAGQQRTVGPAVPLTCLFCEFFREVREQEGDLFRL